MVRSYHGSRDKSSSRGGNMADYDYESVSTEELLDWHINFKSQVDTVQNKLNRIEWTLTRRMEADGAREVLHARATCILTPAKPMYVIPTLQSLAEVVPPEIYEQGWEPEYQKPMPAKFNMVQVNKWGRKYGKPVTDIIDAARLPDGPARLQIAPKENNDG
jgi:hypothetical protein